MHEDDPARWGADDFVAALFVRDRLEAAIEQVWEGNAAPAVVRVADDLFENVSEPIDSLHFLEWDARDDRWWWKRIPTYGPIRAEIERRRATVSHHSLSEEGLRRLANGPVPTAVASFMQWLARRGFSPAPEAGEDPATRFYRADGMRVSMRIGPEGWELLVGPPVAAGEEFGAFEWATVSGLQVDQTGFEGAARFFRAEWPRVKALSTIPATAESLREARSSRSEQ
ncbi:hypothetical protein Q5716_05230 [Protaetiibacter sp. WY-16]|uniref:DUF4132 domain-containing protein n=2 Tax=Antiquaquibacter soli TaxID=3064523 RepID=A0ABT9BKT1_9MICO|nr:hypothetical protein [Protaetiibacter sp. WY-16]